MAERDEIWSDGTLLAAGGAVASPWVDLRGFDSLVISRNQVGGTYAFEVDWSRDGATVDLTEAVATVEDDQVAQPIAATYGRFRVRNTDAVNAFTAHRTNVFGQR